LIESDPELAEECQRTALLAVHADQETECAMQCTKLPNEVRANHSKPGIRDSPSWFTHLRRNLVSAVIGISAVVPFHSHHQNRKAPRRRRASKDIDIVGRKCVGAINCKSSMTTAQSMTANTMTDRKQVSLVLSSVNFNTSYRW